MRLWRANGGLMMMEILEADVVRALFLSNRPDTIKNAGAQLAKPKESYERERERESLWTWNG